MPGPDYVFEFIPTLRDLLPNSRGIPGIIYLQCTSTNAKRAQDEGWNDVHGAKLYTIRNPATGQSIGMKLVCWGDEIKGLSSQSGTRECYVDVQVEEATGLTIEPTVPSDTTPPPSAKPPKAKPQLQQDLS